MNQHIKFIKLDSDDIIEIILEYYQDQLKESQLARGILLGDSNNELRFIGVLGSEKIDYNAIDAIDLREVDKTMDYNGDHSFLKKNPQFYIKKD